MADRGGNWGKVSPLEGANEPPLPLDLPQSMFTGPGLLALADLLPVMTAYVDANECIRFVNKPYAEWIAKNQITAPGWKANLQFNGIFVTTLTVGYSSNNYIHDNLINDNCARTMHYGISLLDQDGGQAYSNTVVKNATTGGSPGSTGNGVNDWGGATQLSGNTYTSEVCQ